MSGLTPRRSAWRTALAIGLIVLTAGCATPQRSADLARTDDYWTGRLALQIDSNPPQRLNGGFELQGNPERGELRLFTPLGQTVASASWDRRHAILTRGDETRRYADTDSLTTELTGTALPLPALFAWLRGQTADIPGWTADLSRHHEGRLSALRLQPQPSVQLRLVFQ